MQDICKRNRFKYNKTYMAKKHKKMIKVVIWLERKGFEAKKGSEEGIQAYQAY
jgi:hypothetical protein